VVKAPSKLEAQNLHDDLIKRVVGLLGDVVQIYDGQTLINGKVIAEPYVKEEATYNYGPITFLLTGRRLPLHLNDSLNSFRCSRLVRLHCP